MNKAEFPPAPKGHEHYDSDAYAVWHQCPEVADLETENERLRAALQRIAFTDAPQYWAQDEARLVLARGEEASSG